MMNFSPYCDPSNALFLQNLAIAAVIGITLGFVFGKLVQMLMTKAEKSQIRWLLMVCLIAFPFAAAFAALMIYGGIGPTADDCGGTSERIVLPAFMGLITVPTALIGLFGGYWWRRKK
jgi:NhaP-type Na+/H+ or K+/H+ antiporter